MFNISTKTVLLYHSIYKKKDIKSNKLHTVSFKNFSDQVNYLKDNYKIEDIDNIYNSKIKKTAAITFDDGYKDLKNEAIPFLEELKIPYTIYWNPGASKNGFWRDKLRLILNNKKFSNLLLEKINSEINDNSFNLENIYKKSKTHFIDNKLISSFCDEIIDNKGSEKESLLLSFDDLVNLCRDTNFLKIGNHSYGHFNLASLNNEDLLKEIQLSKKLISSLPKSKLSKIFSIPFGGSKDISKQVIKNLEKEGYKGFLMSRNMININNRILKVNPNNIYILERFMPKDEGLNHFKSQIFEVKYKSIIKKLYEIFINKIY